MVAERFAVYNVNPLLSHFSSTDSAYLESFREAVAKARSHIVDLGLPGRCFATTDAGTAEAAIRDGCKWIDIAAASVLPACGSTCRPKRGRSRTGRGRNPSGAISRLWRQTECRGQLGER